MRIAAAYALQHDFPPRPSEARDSQILARSGGDPPSCYRCGAFGELVQFRGPPKHERRNAGGFRRQLQPFRRGSRVFGDFADHPAQSGVMKAFLHRKQHVGVAAGFDMNDAVRMKSSNMQGGGEQISPAQTPKHRPLAAREDAGEEDCRARVVGEIGAPGNFVESAGRDPAARQARIQRLYAKRESAMANPHALNLRDTRTQIFEDDSLTHNIRRLADG